VRILPAGNTARSGIPLVVAGLGTLAFLLLVIALIPAHVAPWYWAERTLAGRRQQFAVSGVMCIAAAGIFVALVFLGG
jgi:hypothetical protein